LSVRLNAAFLYPAGIFANDYARTVEPGTEEKLFERIIELASNLVATTTTPVITDAWYLAMEVIRALPATPLAKSAVAILDVVRNATSHASLVQKNTARRPVLIIAVLWHVQRRATGSYALSDV
jgi:hypothetical protein